MGLVEGSPIKRPSRKRLGTSLSIASVACQVFTFSRKTTSIVGFIAFFACYIIIISSGIASVIEIVASVTCLILTCPSGIASGFWYISSTAHNTVSEAGLLLLVSIIFSSKTLVSFSIGVFLSDMVTSSLVAIPFILALSIASELSLATTALANSWNS